MISAARFLAGYGNTTAVGWQEQWEPDGVSTVRSARARDSVTCAIIAIAKNQTVNTCKPIY